ncbi:MAG TPA: anion permease [Planctomycetaceae bacterium]|nr:anion permease [Planctomycetaceae bacterium]
MNTTFWDAFQQLTLTGQILFFAALAVAFAFEFINGFHDTANAVTTVIYTGTLRPTPAVLFSGMMNFLGVLLGGTAVAFSIVNLLPVDLLIEGSSTRAIVMVLSLLLAGVIWNLGTWWIGLPVSSSHTLIGSILGVGVANSLLTRGNLSGVNWNKATDVGLALLVSPLIGFMAAALLLQIMKQVFRNPNLYHPPGEGDNPPHWIRGVLLATCGGVSFAHGSNDGQKGMGLVLLALIGFLPAYYSLDLRHPELAHQLVDAAAEIDATLEETKTQTPELHQELHQIQQLLADRHDLSEVPADHRWQVRQSIFRFRTSLAAAGLPSDVKARINPLMGTFQHAIEYVPLWVVVGTALALGIGTTIGYKRIVVTIAEKIGKTHLTYAQGAAAETVAAITIFVADKFHLPVSTTHVLSSGVAGTMWSNSSGVQPQTVRKILLAWIFTLPAAMTIAATLFLTFGWMMGAEDMHLQPVAQVSQSDLQSPARLPSAD